MVLYWRLCFAVSAITAAVIAMFAGLAVLQFSQIRSELERDRIGVLAARTAQPLEAAARIGLPISSVRNLGALVQRAAQTDDAIVAIHVVAADGSSILSTGRASADPRWRIPSQAASTIGTPGWSGETEDGFFSGTVVTDGRGRPVVGVVIEYSRQESATRAWAVAARLGAGGLVLTILGAVLAALLLRVGLRSEIAAFDSLERDIDGFERECWRATTAPPTMSVQHNDARPPFAALLRDVEAQYQATARAVAVARPRRAP